MTLRVCIFTNGLKVISFPIYCSNKIAIEIKCILATANAYALIIISVRFRVCRTRTR